MKTIRLGLAALLFAGIARAEAINALEIISYFPKEGAVVIRDATGRTNRPFSSFSPEEQHQIRSWAMDERFKSAELVERINEQETEEDYFDETRQGSSKRITTRGSVKTVFYEVSFENDTDVDFDDLQIEYRVFFVQDKGPVTRTGTYEKKICRVENVKFSIKAGESIISATPSITIRNLKIDSPAIEPGDNSPAGITRHLKDDLEGLYVCVSRKDKNGIIHTKTYCEGQVPEEKDWGEYLPQEKGGSKKTPSSVTPGTKKKENWADYQQQENQNSAKQASKAKSKSPEVGGTLSEEELRYHIQNSKMGSYMSALLVAEYYYRQGDQEKTKQWADKVRRLVKGGPKESRERAQERVAERLALLDQMEETATSR